MQQPQQSQHQQHQQQAVMRVPSLVFDDAETQSAQSHRSQPPPRQQQQRLKQQQQQQQQPRERAVMRFPLIAFSFACLLACLAVERSTFVGIVGNSIIDVSDAPMMTRNSNNSSSSSSSKEWIEEKRQLVKNHEADVSDLEAQIESLQKDLDRLADNSTTASSDGGNDSSSSRQQRHQQQRRKARLLMGIFCRDSDEIYREKHRELFGLNPLVCSLGQYEREQKQQKRQQQREDAGGGGGNHNSNDSNSNDSNSCQFVYTFVVGGNKDENGPTELLDDRIPVVIKKEDDVVTLNIKENMEDGKSLTYFYFATTLMKNSLDFDYVAKMDTDTLLHLDEYFEFADSSLRPHPYNARTVAGMFTDKAWWGSFGRKRLGPKEGSGRFKVDEKERFFEKHYTGFKTEVYTDERGRGRNGKKVMIGMHIYPCGEFYIYSSDLVKRMVHNASRGQGKYLLEGREDHDIGTLAYYAADGTPMNLLLVSGTWKFWTHPVKRKGDNKEWEDKWNYWITCTKSGNCRNDRRPKTSPLLV